MSTEENKAIVRRFIEEIFNKRNLAALEEVWAANLVWHGTGGFPDVQGVEPLKQVIQPFYTAFPDLHVTTEDLIAEGDKVVGRFTNRATHRGSLMGIPPTGKQVTWASISIYRIAGGKIVEEWIGDDTLGMMQQLGAIPTPGQPPK